MNTTKREDAHKTGPPNKLYGTYGEPLPIPIDDTPDWVDRDHSTRWPDDTPAFPPTEEHCPWLDLIVPAKSEGADIVECVCTPINAEAHPLAKYVEEVGSGEPLRDPPAGPWAEDACYGVPGEAMDADMLIANISPAADCDGDEPSTFV